MSVGIRWAESRTKKLVHGARVLRRLGEAAAIRASLPQPLARDPGGLPAPGSIVILGTGYIGDLVLATPTLRLLRDAFRSARITLVVESRVQDLFAEAEVFDRLLPIDRADRRTLLEHGETLRSERPDVAVVLPHTVDAALFAYATGAPIRVGHDSQGRRFLLTRVAPNDKTVHEVERLRGLARALGVRVGALSPPEVWPGSSAREGARRMLAALPGDGEPVVALPIGATNPARRWPPSRWASLIRQLAEARAARFLLLGAPADRAAAEEIRTRAAERAAGVAEAVRDPSRLLDLSGKTTLAEAAWLFDAADLVVGSDSGLLHLAVARGRRVVGLYGPGDPVAWGPYGAGHAVVRLAMACSPCANHVCSSIACIRRLPVAPVLAESLAILDRWRGG